jgi:hypothetical protein
MAPAPRVEGRRPSRWRALLRDEKGAVMAEAIIMLPALILIWGIILYIHFAFRDAQRNLATLRDDAWTHAFTGCTTSPAAPTEIAEGGEFDGDSRSGGIDGLGDALRWVSTSLFMIDEFGARREATVARPESLGGGTRSLRWEMLILCNEQEAGDPSLLESIFDFFSGA